MVSIDPNGHDCKAEWFDGMGCRVNDPHYDGCQHRKSQLVGIAEQTFYLHLKGV